MKITVNRNPTGLTCTIGDLLIDGAEFCHVLEDPIREIPGEPVESWKVKGDTAIPAGTYTVALTYSNRFQRDLPLIQNVPGFDGIRIHGGNTSADTEGCLLVGVWTGGEFIHNSQQTLKNLLDVMEIAVIGKQDITIEICNPEAET